jgi:hypothetical protein
LITPENLIGLALVLLAAGLILAPVFLASLKRGKAPRQGLRVIPALEALRKAVGLSVEDGRRLHISLGSASILDSDNASALVGLSALEQLTQISMSSDRPAVCTTGNGSLAILAQDSMRYAYRSGNAMDQYDPDQAFLAGVTPFSYAVGAIPSARDPQTSANIFIGHFGPEIALMNDAATQKGIFTLAASDSLSAQAAIFATADETLIGEELFALPAYLQNTPTALASLRAQDVLRWVIIVIMLVGAILKLAGSLLGITII